MSGLAQVPQSCGHTEQVSFAAHTPLPQPVASWPRTSTLSKNTRSRFEFICASSVMVCCAALASGTVRHWQPSPSRSETVWTAAPSTRTWALSPVSNDSVRMQNVSDRLV